MSEQQFEIIVFLVSVIGTINVLLTAAIGVLIIGMLEQKGKGQP